MRAKRIRLMLKCTLCGWEQPVRQTIDAVDIVAHAAAIYCPRRTCKRHRPAVPQGKKQLLIFGYFDGWTAIVAADYEAPGQRAHRQMIARFDQIIYSALDAQGVKHRDRQATYASLAQEFHWSVAVTRERFNDALDDAVLDMAFRAYKDGDWTEQLDQTIKRYAKLIRHQMRGELTVAEVEAKEAALHW